MAHRVFLHVGTPKTGTTYLQSLVWTNRETLAERDLLLPLRGVHDHFYLSTLARQAKAPMAAMPASGHTAWQRLAKEVSAWPGDALVSHELFAATPPHRVRWVLDELGALCDEVHVILTARDFGRQVPAEWQQSVKHGRTHGFQEYCETLQAEDPDRTDVDRQRGSTLFWRVQHLPRLLDDWNAGPAAGRVHLVTVPPRHMPHAVLWDRFAAVLGVDQSSVDTAVTVPNESLGIDEIETLRRVNLLIPAQMPRPRVQLLVKQVLAEGVLAGRTGMRRLVAPAQLHAWMVERGTRMVEQVQGNALHLTGDLDDLVSDPQPPEGSVPAQADAEAVARVAVETIATLLFDSDNLAVRRLVDDQRSRAAELERREGAHPLRAYSRHTVDEIKRWLRHRSR